MTRFSGARVGLRWTAAGLLLLAGCGDDAARSAARGASESTEQVARWIAPIDGNQNGTSHEPRRLPANDRDAASGPIVPVWYPFDDPAPPTLRPADGAAPVSARSQPAVQAAPSNSGQASSSTFERLPPVNETMVAPGTGTMFAPQADGVRTPAPPARYVVDSPYSLGPDSGRLPRRHADGPATQGDVEAPPASTTVERRYDDHPYSDHQHNDSHATAQDSTTAGITAAPIEDAPAGIQQTRDAGRNSQFEFERLPSGAPVFPAPSVHRDDRAATQRRIPPAVRDLHNDPSVVTLPKRDAQPIKRPKDAVLDEARTIARFERLPPVEETVASRSETVASRSAPPTVSAQETPTIPAPVGAAASQSNAVAAAPAEAPRRREMELIGERAGECIRRAYDLANRGALYSAESEFTKALSMVAQALDAQHGQSDARHAKALAAGLVALEESDDFIAGAVTDTNMDVSLVVARHRTPVLKNVPTADLSPIVAMQRYYTFAQEQLAAAAENESAASSALYGLGKIQTTLQANRSGEIADGPKAIALHQAALLVDRRNYLAANELGVLMARCGHYDAAEAALRHSLKVAPTPAVWNNLAAVHDRLGQQDRAIEARTQAIACAKTPSAATATRPGEPQQPVVWMDQGAFAQSSRPDSDLKNATLKNTADSNSPKTEQPAAQVSKKGFAWPFK